MIHAKDLHTWGTEAVLPKVRVLRTELKARVQVVLAKALLTEQNQAATARDLRTRATEAVLHIVALRMRRRDQEVLIGAPVLMGQELMAFAKVLLTEQNQAAPASANRRNRPDGEVGTDFQLIKRG